MMRFLSKKAEKCDMSSFCKFTAVNELDIMMVNDLSLSRIQSGSFRTN